MPEAMAAGGARTARAAFKVAVQTEPALAAAARGALATIVPAVLSRDHISRVTKTLLEDALNG